MAARIRVHGYHSEMTVIELVCVRNVLIIGAQSVGDIAAKVNMNNVNIFCGIVLILLASCSF